MAKRTVLNPSKSPRDWRVILPGAAIFLLVIVAYIPSLWGEFIWDDDHNVTKNTVLRSFGGLFRIWFQIGATPQYYPLTHTSFWLDWHLWGLHPLPYHLENILLHAVATVLLWRVLRRLDVKGAWLGAALFALHPVCVESVAWITERKNTLSAVFFLTSIWAALEFWLPRDGQSNARHTPSERKKKTRSAIPSQAVAEAEQQSPDAFSGIRFGPWKFYWLAVGLYLCALWSKTSVVCLPGVVLLVVWWKRKRLVLWDGMLLTPFLVVGLGIALITMSVEKHLMLVNANADDWQFSPMVRLLIAGRAVWFYLGKLVWPHPLMFIYPRWPIEESPLPGYVALAAAVAAGLILWLNRNGWGRPVLVAAGYFGIMLFPVLGFFNVFFFYYSFVSDHFQYLAAMGPLALAGAGIATAQAALSKRQPLAAPALAGAVLLGLGTLTWRQTAVFRNSEALWRDSVAHNPESWMAQDNLGICLSESARFEEADTHYRRAIELRPKDYVAFYDLGLEAALKGNLDEASGYFDKALAINPRYAVAHYNLANVLARKQDLDGAIQEYDKALQISPELAVAHFNLGNALVQKKQVEEAIAEYRKTLEWDPDYAPAAFNLGNLFASQGKTDEAIEQLELAIELQPNYAAAHAALGRVLAAQGNSDEAIQHYLKALEIDPNSVEAAVNLGNARLKEGRLDEAVGYYRAALRSNPNSPVIHHNLAVALVRQGNKAEGQAELDEANRLAGRPAVTR